MDMISLMPWLCPACEQAIAHTSSEDTPRVGTIYRCRVCRIDLTLDPDTKTFGAAPFVRREDDDADSTRKP
jgi:hypothetical protein